jgi:CRISPR/Cas system-associated endonuclease Cas1
MRPLLLTDYGTCLKTKDRRLVLQNQDSGARKEWLPVDFPFDSIIVEHLGGFVTFPALRWLATNGVSLTALDFNGTVLGQWLPECPMNPLARLAQIAAYLNPESRLAVARFILEAKVGKVPTAYRTWDDLLTFEGRQAVRFWSDLGITRDYPNARDPTNATINYAFGLLGSQARLAIHRASLEPSVGFLHVPQNYKTALVYDVMEPFRAATVKTALKLREGLNSRDFGEVFGHGLRLRPQAGRKVVEGFARSFAEREMARFVERMSLRCASAARAGSNLTEPQTGGRTAPLLSA